MATNFEQHIDEEKLHQVATDLRNLKQQMDQKVTDILTETNKLESNYAYESDQSREFKEAFQKFQTETQSAFDLDMDAFANFIDKVATEHSQLAAKISQNITTLDNSKSEVLSAFN